MALARLQALAAVRGRLDYRPLQVRLERYGLVVQHTHVHLLCREAGLPVRRRRRKRITVGERASLSAATQRLMRGAVGFAVYTLADGHVVRTSNVVDA